jgi:acetoin:2,6-dichlorophenolindophenol oxidoreductase subunit beta
VPVTVRCAVGAGGRFGAIHSQSPGTWFNGVPGLKVVAPSSSATAKALLKQSIRDDNPVIFLEHKRLYSTKSPADEQVESELGRASVVRSGADVTLVSLMTGIRDCLEAADRLSGDGVGAEVIDLQALRPLDVATVIASLEKTNRLVCVEEGPCTGGWASGLVGEVATRALDLLDDVQIVCTPDHPIPFAATLEDAFLPGPAEIVSAVLAGPG